MPVWLIPMLIKYGVPLLITILDKTGATNWAEGIALKAGYTILEGVEGTRRFSKPTNFPDEPPQPTKNNLTNKPME